MAAHAHGTQSIKDAILAGIDTVEHCSLIDDEGIARGAWMPSVDIYENKDQIVLEAELPGMKQEEFDLSIENNVRFLLALIDPDNTYASNS